MMSSSLWGICIYIFYLSSFNKANNFLHTVVEVSFHFCFVFSMKLFQKGKKINVFSLWKSNEQCDFEFTEK